MSKFTADEVEALAEKYNYPPDAIGFRNNNHYEMLSDLARRLRQEEEENRRDPVMEPRPGDRISLPENHVAVWNARTPSPQGLAAWKTESETPGATIIRRREAQQ